MCVQGAVLIGDSWTIQPLTDLLWVGNTTDTDAQIEKVARLFRSLKTALNTLASQFERLIDTPELPPSLAFPAINSYVDTVTEVLTTFTYTRKLDFQKGRVPSIFEADASDGDPLFIKFVTRYNAAAHRLLANKGFAPRLLHVAPLESGATHFVVVMKRIAGEDMHGKLFTDQDLKRVRSAIKLLHDENCVFGDLRPNNILRPSDGAGVLLVDFDWCGEDGKAKYPPSLNEDRKCGWHPDVKGGAVMKKMHDDHLLNSFVHA